MSEATAGRKVASRVAGSLDVWLKTYSTTTDIRRYGHDGDGDLMPNWQETRCAAPGWPANSGDREKPPNHKRGAILASLALAIVFMTVAGASAYAGIVSLATGPDSHLRPAAFVVATFFLITGAAVPAALVQEGCIEEEEDKKCKRDCDDLAAALDRIGDCTLAGLAKANFRQMRMFTTIALRQVRMSYYASLAAAAVALLILAAGSAVTEGLAGDGAKITAATLTATGSALSGLLAATFLNTYRLTARQMSYYYGQPLVHCYLMHAEWLTLRLSQDKERKTEADLDRSRS
jgi:hypothetical protein